MKKGLRSGILAYYLFNLIFYNEVKWEINGVGKATIIGRIGKEGGDKKRLILLNSQKKEFPLWIVHVQVIAL